MTTRFTAEVDKRCQRGLHWHYRCPTMTRSEAGALHRAIVDRWGDALERESERWGARTTHRLVLPFRFEIRLGYSQREFSFIHRVSVCTAQRAADRKALEHLLAAVLPEVAPESTVSRSGLARQPNEELLSCPA